jgi:hypothetical protein
MAEWTVGHILELVYEQLDADQTVSLLETLQGVVETPTSDTTGSKLIRGIKKYYEKATGGNLNTLKANLKAAIRECLEEKCYTDADEDTGLLADVVFDVMKIDSHDQDKVDYKVAVNPKVVCQVSGGMISLVECDNKVKVELRDYDIETTTNEEFKAHGEEVFTDGNGDRYITK